jgi:subtilisin family serine protease
MSTARADHHQFSGHRLRWLAAGFVSSALLFLLLTSLPTLAESQQNLPAPVQTDRDQPTTGRDVQAFIIYLEAHANLTDDSLPDDLIARRQAVIGRLQQVASSSQADLLDTLRQMQATKRVIQFEPLWIVNAVLVEGERNAIERLADRPEVGRVEPDTRRQWVGPIETFPAEANGQWSWGVQRVGAPHVWHGLGVTGQGVTVAIMDSGVDWQHPVLKVNYRGTQPGGGANHANNWADFVDGSLAPVDANGHGTHVAGTAVGQEGIGTAPGAKWIAVRVLDENGGGTIGDIHRGFQWLMAPNGNPALAPDLVNNSWGGSPELVDFVQDVAALQAAGIIPLFAAGNDGPFPGTVGAPANYPDTLAIGATDPRDAVTWFSARGPSGLTSETKPTFVAPGARVLSSLPGGTYGYRNGTSMAAPHATGAYALALSAAPSLSRLQLTRLFTSTASVIGASQPTDDSGWGRLDAYAAVAQISPGGTLQGVVLNNNQPLPGIAITITTPGAVALPFVTDASGRYSARLQPGLYQIQINKYGLNPYTAGSLLVNDGQTTTHNINLVTLPGGRVRGYVRQAGTRQPVNATVIVAGKPLSVTTGVDGYYSVRLPVGQYELLATSNGHRVDRHVVNVAAGSTIGLDFQLNQGPSTLLVDTGQWYWQSQAGYFAQALLASDYGFDRWSVANLFYDAPTADDLAEYDVVVWSSPFDSPGPIGASDAISTYLGLGGNLLISGQNVALQAYDPLEPQSWWYRHLRGDFLGKTAWPVLVSGESGSVFAALNPGLNGSGSAQNQRATDQVRPRLDSFTEVAFRYPDGQAAGLMAGQCADHNIVYLGFGLEGVNDQVHRSSIISASYDYFALPDTESGIRFSPSRIDDFAVPGTQITYTLRIYNLSETMTDTFALTTSTGGWSASLITPSLTLGPCEAGQTYLTISVPPEATANLTHTIQVSAASANEPGLHQAMSVYLKTPGHILLVNDSRWFNRAALYQAALGESGFEYDYWVTGSTPLDRGSPSQALLNAYDIIIWYTGYDWYAPLTAEEIERLIVYLDQGGRLFLSSQDYLFRHPSDPFTRDYLGVADFRESITPTLIFEAPDLPLLGRSQDALPLDYGPYRNYSDGLLPASGSRISVWHNRAMAGGLATANADWRTIFWALPFETLPAENLAPAMNQIVGWLSDLGDTSFVVDRRTTAVTAPESWRTYSLTLRNTERRSNQVMITNTLPAELVIDPATITGAAAYDPVGRQLTWSGLLGQGASHLITYLARPAAGLSPGRRIENPVTIHMTAHNLRFVQSTPLWIEAPDLSPSHLSVAPLAARPQDSISYDLVLWNDGLAGGTISGTLFLPAELRPLTDTLAASSGQVSLSGGRVSWQGTLLVGQKVTITLNLTSPLYLRPLWLPAISVVDDATTNPLVQSTVFYLAPFQAYFPTIAKH